MLLKSENLLTAHRSPGKTIWLNLGKSVDIGELVF